MRKNRLLAPLAILMSAVLTACGGGSDTGGAFQGGTTSGGTTTTTPAVATVTATTSATSIPTDGSASASIKVFVRDSGNVLLANVPVTFSASSGGLSAGTSTTDASGVATATLVTAGDATPRTITVTAKAGGVTSTTTVAVTPSNTVTVASVTPVASPTSIPTDGTIPSEVRVYVRNAANQLIAGVPVNFSVTSGGVAVTQGTTDAGGMAIATVSTVGNSNPRTITLTATAGGVSGTVDIAVVGTAGANAKTVASITGTTDVASIPADGSANATVKFYVRNANNQLISGVPVTISASSGGVALANGGVTDANGVATATISTAGNSTARTITVTGAAGSFTANVAVQVVAAAGSGTSTVQSVAVTSNVASIPSTGSTPAQLQVYVRNASNVLMAGVPVTFASSSGAIAVTQGTTDANGLATATLSTGGDATPRSITVTASAGGVSGTTTVAVVNVVSAVTVTSSTSPITNDGAVTTTLTATARNSSNAGVAGVLVTFGTTAGNLSAAQAVTDGSGNATVTLSANGVAAATNITVTATSNGQSGTATVAVVKPVASVAVTSSTPAIASNGATTATITATARDASGGAVAGVTVSFAAPTGQLSVTQAVTNASGVATATLSAGSNTAARTITVTASTNGVSGTTSVDVVAPVAKVLVASSTGTIPTDGTSPATITVTVLDAGNAAVRGVPVSFAASSGAVAVTQAVTDGNGIATATLTTGNDATVRTITVTATAAGISGSTSVQVAGTSVSAVASLGVVASNRTIPTDGSVSSVITVTVRNSSNVAVAGVPVSFNASSGTLTVTPAAPPAITGVTDANGQVTASLSTGGNSTPRTITVSATAGGVTNSTTVTVGPYYVVDLTASAPTMASDGSAPVSIRATVRNPNNQYVSGVPVAFTATNNGGLLVNSTITDVAGSITATLSPGSDPSNRSIAVTVTAGGVSASVNVDVVGTRLTIQGPTSLIFGQTGSYSLLLVDSGGKGIANKTLTATSTAGNTVTPATVTTDNSGRATVTLTTVSTSADTLKVTGLGLEARQAITVNADSFTFTSPAAGTEINLGGSQAVQVTWLRNGVATLTAGQTVTFSTTRGTVTATATTNGSGVATATLTPGTDVGGVTVTATTGTGLVAQRTFEYVATTPATVTLVADAYSLSPSQSVNVYAYVRDANSNPVKNKTVNFSLVDVSGGSLSSGTVTTDSQGRAATIYTAGSQTSGANGVTITATEPVSAKSGTASLTVAQPALFISLGTGNTISKPTQPQYAVQFAAQVTDGNGVGVPNVAVSSQILSTTFYKGGRVAPVSPSTLWTTNQTTRCVDEDVNHNGVLDPGEDINGNGKIEAGNVATVSQGSLKTDANGFVYLTVTYPASYAYYVDVDLSVFATGSGTNYVRTSHFSLPGMKDDFTDPQVPPGLTSPFGAGNAGLGNNVCTNTN